MRALVIEDDDSVRAALRRALMLDGWEIFAATDGQEGLLEANSSQPDVIVLDLGLPVLDGLEVCRRLRREGNRTPGGRADPHGVPVARAPDDQPSPRAARRADLRPRVGHDFSLAGNSLRVYIGYLRRKLEAGGEPRLIQTVHGVGYVLREP